MKSWKTTLAGLLLGIATITAQMTQARAADPNAPPVTAGNILPGLAIAVIGALAKDFDKTNSPNPVETQSAKDPL